MNRKYTRFGYSLFADIERITEEWSWKIETVLDVGANVGQFATDALRHLQDAKIYSFEPHPNSYAALVSTVVNDRSRTYRIAMAKEEGDATFYVYGETGDASLLNSLSSNARFPATFGFEPEQITVQCTTVDTFCHDNGIERIDLIKVDVEGFDLEVLRGAEHMLRSGKVRFVYVEFNDLLPKFGMTGGALVPIAEYLARFGLVYLVTYTDFVLYEQRVSVCANALFAAAPVIAKSEASR